eukprot:CAMPEP_0117687178 /NCGR_PEP_ID=MMETSP0804-20121206/22971_1 /TAXON_ID=1074897 /ORGANISM="Tetraselmis astigmatica, Strain CCMP880" /LENGTH=132 /DNA_ID=CAMNT_0005499173 /DNA_START=149 /DNA_END=544 /DNA_ORIENTATION=-
MSGQPPQRPGGTSLKIADLRPSTKPIQAVKFIVLEKGPVQVIHATDEAKNQVEIPICTALVADETACCHFQLNGAAEVDYVNAGDIVRLTQGMFTFYKNSLMLKAGRRGLLERVGEFTMVFSEAVNVSLLTW